jgi:hypothetical protein
MCVSMRSHPWPRKPRARLGHVRHRGARHRRDRRHAHCLRQSTGPPTSSWATWQDTCRVLAAHAALLQRVPYHAGGRAGARSTSRRPDLCGAARADRALDGRHGRRSFLKGRRRGNVGNPPQRVTRASHGRRASLPALGPTVERRRLPLSSVRASRSVARSAKRCNTFALLFAPSSVKLVPARCVAPVGAATGATSELAGREPRRA